MPVTITATGANDVVLDQVASDGGFPVTHAGSTRNRIEQVAEDAAAGDVPAMSDRNAIEWLAGALGAFSYMLDDDGTYAATLGYLLMPADAPEYLTLTHDFEASDDGVAYLATPAGIGSVVSRPGKVVAIQMNFGAMPAPLAGAGEIRFGPALGLVDEGAVTYAISAAVSVTAAGATLSIYALGGGAPIASQVLAGYAGGECKVAIYADLSDGRIGYTYNGTDYGYMAAAGAAEGVLAAAESKRTTDVAAGLVIDAELFITPAGIDQPVPAGAIALNGALIE